MVGSVSEHACMIQIRAHVHGLANWLCEKWNIGDEDVVCIYSPNHIEYPGIIWAAHRIGAIVTTANPDYNIDELSHVLISSHAKLIIAHPANYSAALSAAKAVGIPDSHVILIEALHSVRHAFFKMTDD